MKTTDRITKLVLTRKPQIGVRGFKRDLANTCGVSYEAVRQWFAGDTENIKNENLISIAEGYDTTVDWLLAGTGEPPRRKGGQVEEPETAKAQPQSAADLVRDMLAKKGKNLSEEARSKLLAAADAGGTVIEAEFGRPGLVGDEVSIAHYDIRAAMGGGQLPADYPQVLRDVRVSQQHLRDLGLMFTDFNYLKIVNGWGSSMEPTIKHRDPLIVDVSIREFIGDGVYLLSWDSLLYVKRLQAVDSERLEMISDNPRHKDRIILREDIFILARVLMVWNAHLL